MQCLERESRIQTLNHPPRLDNAHTDDNVLLHAREGYAVSYARRIGEEILLDDTTDDVTGSVGDGGEDAGEETGGDIHEERGATEGS